MFQAGDVLVAALPLGYYGAIKILKAEIPGHENEELYIIAATQYFGKEKPQITDPLLRKIAIRSNSDMEHIYFMFLRSLWRSRIENSPRRYA